MSPPMAEELILVAAADAATRAMLAQVLAANAFACVVASTSAEAVEHARRRSVALVLVDENVPGGALCLVDDLRVFEPPIAAVICLGEQDAELALESGRRGAYDFITKPFDSAKVPIRIRVALERRRTAIQEHAYRTALEKRINVRTKEVWDKKEKLRTQLLNTINALVKALQAKHDYTGEHSRRVADVSIALARALRLPETEIHTIELAALFHDIGKIGLRDDVLNKPGSLTPAEYEHVKMHPLIAEEILSPIEDFAPLLAIVKHEHERFDGGGYPGGLKGEEIPLGARIIAIADTYDALLTDRSYRKGCPRDLALAEIRRCAGTQFDPKLVESFDAFMSRPDAPNPAAPNGAGTTRVVASATAAPSAARR